MERPIRNSAKAFIIQDGKMLAIKVRDENEEWYIMPGGGQKPEELLSDTVRREVAEETGLNVIPKELVFVVEGTHGEAFHRADFVFLCEYVGEAESAVPHGNAMQVGYNWLDIKTLNHAPLYPSKLRRQIMNLYEGKPHLTYLGNESAGDPEITD